MVGRRLRFGALLMTLTALVASGCYQKAYEMRLDRTLDQMKYQQELDDNLKPAIEDPLRPQNVFVRPPNALEKSSGNILGVLPGMFDATASLLESSKAIETSEKVHVLVRHKQAPPAANSKKGAAPVQNTESRKEFIPDLLNLFPAASNIKLDNGKVVDKKKNKFRLYVIPLPQDRTLEIYHYADSKKDYEVGFVVERPAKSALTRQVGLMLECFAVGGKAQTAFEGGESDDIGDDSGGGGGGGGEEGPVAL